MITGNYRLKDINREIAHAKGNQRDLARTILSLRTEVQRLTKALEQIAGCKSHHSQDVVGIAKAVLRQGRQ